MTDLRARLQEGLSGSYALERELGRGGMATVFLARDLKHDRPVALKVLHPELAASLGAERFLREIHLAASLQHPHILTVLDSGQVAVAGAPPLLWFTMPFIRGESLRDRLRRETQLPVEDALRIAREAADALGFAHGEGIVHRDIKPENILLTGMHALVADFGIARALGAGRDGQLTETGLTVGTPAYMSPEQASGQRELDGRTDLYSLAVVLYEMLAGETPFAAPTAQAMVARRFMESARPIRELRDSVPEPVERALGRALARTAADRFGTMAQFADALQGGHTSGATAVVVERSAVTPSAGVAAAATTAAPTAAAPTAASSAGRRRFPLAASALIVGLLVGGGALFAWRRSHPDGEPGAAGERRIAVLPFQNVGDSADAYFADGITDAVRGKLTALPSMRVIGSNSSGQYRGTTKTPREIGRELGVDYLLVGKVRWARAKDGTSRVQVSPELIDVATADAKWQQPFDASLTDVFQVQADIAGRVAEALDVAIGTPQQKVLENRPTGNLAAYDAFLKGMAQRAFGPTPAALREAVRYFEQAVALDSAFVLAWAQLSVNSTLLYNNGTPSPALLTRARFAADRALALDPQNPAGYRALGILNLIAGTPEQAVEPLMKGLAFAPNEPNLLRNLGGAEQRLGRWEQAVEHLRRSSSLDPRSVTTLAELGTALLLLRRYDEATQALDAGLALEPANLGLIETKAMTHLARGDLAGAQAMLAQPAPGLDVPTLVAYFATYWDLYWVLDADQRALIKRFTPAAFDGDAGSWGLALAGVYEVEHDRRRAAAYGDSARIAFEQQLYAAPDNIQLHALLGVALAYVGRKEAAVREGQRAVAADSSQGQLVMYYRHQLARIHILNGEQAQALDVLEPLLKQPYHLSPGWLRIDPTFDPLRSNPRFKKLVEGTAAGA